MPDVYSLIHYSYFVLFLVILAGVIGLPVPLEGVLLFAGVQVEKGLMGFYPTISIAIIAVFTGSLINYRIASWLGLWKLAHLGKKVHLPVRIWKKSVRFISRYGMWAVPLSYFIPGIRIGVSYGAGLFGLPLQKFVISSFLGVVGWVGIYLWFGHFLV